MAFLIPGVYHSSHDGQSSFQPVRIRHADEPGGLPGRHGPAPGQASAEADGETSFRARRAILPGYKKISPDHTYLYAVPERHGRIRGYLIGPLSGETLSALLQYEGRNYSRRTVKVQTRTGPEKATVFVGNVKQLAHAFGYDFHDRLKQEIILEEKIEAALVETEQQQLHRSSEVLRRAVAELHGSTIRDLRRRHFEAGGISDYAIRRSLMDVPLPDFDRIASDPEARALAPNYLAMVIRQVIFNQFEDRIRKDFRYEIEQLSPGPSTTTARPARWRHCGWSTASATSWK